MKERLFGLTGLAFSLTTAAQDFRITHDLYLCDMTQDGETIDTHEFPLKHSCINQ